MRKLIKSKAFLLSLAFLFLSLFGFAWLKPVVVTWRENNKNTDNQYVIEENDWAEKTLKSMTLEEKIAQLVVIRIHSNQDSLYEAKMVDSIARWQPGGVCFFQGSPVREAALTNRIQQVSKVPLLVTIDGEWGVAMRLDSTPALPRQMVLGALPAAADSLIYAMGREVGRECRLLGIHVNFAPCIDVNNNPKNPVINSRSFGEDREKVAAKGSLYMKGMQSAGIVTCAKHFPGHGDTGTDSHLALPKIVKSYGQIDSLELYPFKKLFADGVEMVMVAHLNVPALDSGENAIASLSRPIVTDLLKKKMGFQGVVTTDGLEMRGVRQVYRAGGEAEIRALQAGNDLLLLPEDLAVVIPAIKVAIDNGRLSEKEIDEKCLKVLKMKEKLGLSHFKPISLTQLYEQLNTPQVEALQQTIFANALTLLKNEENLLPLRRSDSAHMALLCIGNLQDSTHLQQYAKQWNLKFVHCDKMDAVSSCPNIWLQLEKFDTVLVFLLGTHQSPVYKYGISAETADLLKILSVEKKLALCLFGNPYGLSRLGDLSVFSSISIAYQPYVEVVPAVLEAMFGERDFCGTLPVSVSAYPAGTGLSYRKVLPKQSHLAQVGEAGNSVLPQEITRAMDSLILQAIHDDVIPGCQVLALQSGKMLYHKNFGYDTYSHNANKVNDSTLYDIASITKAMATTLAVMKLYEEHKIQLTDSISQYLDYLKNSDKSGITIAELLTHTSGLSAFIPFYAKLCHHTAHGKTFSTKQNEKHNIPVAANMWLSNRYTDTLRQGIARCPLKPKRYLYSDLNFVLLKELVEVIENKPLDQYLEEKFYAPLHLRNTLFNPWQRIDLKRIAPTEKDTYFRHQQIRGYVHDQTAAVYGGVSGNAGLFSTATDLAVLCQMLLNGGEYGGKRYFKVSTVEFFTFTYPMHECRRRGLGFDTPDFEQKSGLFPEQASRYVYGHQGFTGVVFWCDPANEMFYIFLSNRVYPSCTPNKLAQSNLRTNLHALLYQGVEMMQKKGK